MSGIGVDWEARVDWQALRTGRVKRVDESAASSGVDAVLVQRPANVRYLTSMRGFVSMLYQPRYAAFLPVGGDVVMLTEAGDYAIATEGMPWLKDVRVWSYDLQGNAQTVASLLTDNGLGSGRLAIDDMVSPFFVRELEGLLPDLEIVDGTQVMGEARIIKIPEEIDILRKSSEIVEIGIAAARNAMKVGAMECELAGEMLKAMVFAGADAVVSHPQVSTDAMRRMSSDNRIRFGQLVLLDINVGYNGYVGDMARTFVVGKATDEQKRAFATQIDCLNTATDMVGPGVDSREIHKAVEKIIKQAGLETHWASYITGHGIGMGLVPWEQPVIGSDPGEITELREGMVLAFEPGLFDPAIGPVRNENMVLVTGTGHEVITRFEFDERLM